MKGSMALIFILIMSCAVAWSYLTPISEGVDLRTASYYEPALDSNQDWTTYAIGGGIDLDEISRVKMLKMEEERRMQALANERERENGVRVEHIYQDWGGR